MDPPLLHYPTLLELKALDEDGTLIPELLEAFETDGRATLSALTAAAKSSDLPAIARLSHRMKSGAATMGAARIAERCRDLEESARDGRTFPYDACISQLTTDLQDTLSILRWEVLPPHRRGA